MAQYPSATTTIAANRLQTKADTAGQTILSVSGVATTNGTSAGTYAQVTASTSAEYLVTGIVVTTLSGFTGGLVADLPLIIELATGAGGSEVVKSTFKVNKVVTVSATNILGDEAKATVPLRVSSGTRLAVRATKSAAGAAAAFTVQVDVIVVPYANVEGN